MVHGEYNLFGQKTDGRELTLADSIPGNAFVAKPSQFFPARPARSGDALTDLRTTADQMRNDGPNGALFARTLDGFGDFAEGILAECDATIRR